MKTTHTKTCTHISQYRVKEFDVSVNTEIKFDLEKDYNWITTCVTEHAKDAPEWRKDTAEISIIYFPNAEVLESYLEDFVRKAIATLEVIRLNKQMAEVSA